MDFFKPVLFSFDELSCFGNVTIKHTVQHYLDTMYKPCN